MDAETHPHAAIIDSHGGVSAVVARLGIANVSGATQRVSNWKRRGIPAAVRLKHGWLNSARSESAPEQSASPPSADDWQRIRPELAMGAATEAPGA